MFPLRDTTPSEHFPLVNTILIGMNIACYFFQLSAGNNLDALIYTYGLVPARYSVPSVAAHFSLSQQLWAPVSFMFLHGSLWHLIANMWSLYIFGDNIEDRMGHLRYFCFYLLCGVASGLCHLWIYPYSSTPTIGASGAIAGVMGAYLILYPQSKILTLIPIIVIPFFFEIPALYFLGGWFLLQFFNAAGADGQAGGIAWWAHVGGFVGGIILLKAFVNLPSAGLNQRLQIATKRRKSYRLQVIRPHGPVSDPNLYATIEVTDHEARFGAEKTINIPWGFYNRLVSVQVPRGTLAGATLRLAGMGKRFPTGEQGDLLLRVEVRGD